MWLLGNVLRVLAVYGHRARKLVSDTSSIARYAIEIDGVKLAYRAFSGE